MSLRTYTLHVPDWAARGDARALDRARIVADGFSWSAFAFTVLWFVYHRLWLAAVAVLAALAALAASGLFLGLPFPAGLVVVLLASVLIGLEASSLRRWTYGRRGEPARDAVIAASLADAEIKASARWLAGAPSGNPTARAEGTGSGAPTRARDQSVIGLFPPSEARR